MKKIKPFYQIISCFFFALLGLQIKLLMEESSIENIVFFRSFIGSIIIFFFIILSNTRVTLFFKTENIKVHLFRSLCGILAMYFGYKALMYLSLAQASTIGFSKVFFTCIISSFIFSERLNFFTILLVFFGFFGIVLISNPDKIFNNVGLYMSLFSSLCVSGGIICISYLSKKDKTITILLYHSIFSTILFFTLFREVIIFFPSKLTLAFYLTLTVTALLGQYFNTESYKNFETNKVVILSYSRIIFSAIFGFIFLEEQIEITSIFGILIVILTSFLIQRIITKDKDRGSHRESY